MTFMRYNLEKLVRGNHVLREIDGMVLFGEIAEDFEDLEKKAGWKGYGVEEGIRGLFLQFYYDLSDREMEDRLKDDMACR